MMQGCVVVGMIRLLCLMGEGGMLMPSAASPWVVQLGGREQGARLGVHKWAHAEHAKEARILTMQVGEVLQDVRAHLLPGRRSSAAEPAQEMLPA